MRKKKKKTDVMNRKIRKQTKLSARTPFSVREAYKITRTNIMFSLAEEGCRRIAVSSSYPGEGKTTTCTNLAISFAQMGKKVLIIDCDLRRPQVHNVFGLDNQEGISNVLGGLVKIGEVIHYIEEDQISVITSGHIPPNPAELLASERMKKLLGDLEKTYDYIFMDTPPVNLVTDAVTLSNIISGMILVTKQGESTYKDLEASLNKLSMGKVKVLGLVLTGEKHQGGSYGKHGKYGKYGSYKGYTAYE